MVGFYGTSTSTCEEVQEQLPGTSYKYKYIIEVLQSTVKQLANRSTIYLAAIFQRQNNRMLLLLPQQLLSWMYIFISYKLPQLGTHQGGTEPANCSHVIPLGHP